VQVNSIEFKDTGVIFNVTPRINSSGSVMLDILQEISTVNPSTGALTPTIAQRKFSSSINVTNGQTVVLGGLFANTKTRTSRGIPLLHNLPKFGSLFGKRENSNVKTELLVLISPRIVNNGGDAARVSREMSERLSQLKTVETAFANAEH